MKPKPNQAPDDKPQVRRGRPPLGDRAMTHAERQRAYRQRLQRAEIDSIGAEAEASRVTLVGSLAYALAQLDTDRPEDAQQATRLTVGRIIQEIVTRYEIEPPRKRARKG
jgi:hypothetical protein